MYLNDNDAPRDVHIEPILVFMPLFSSKYEMLSLWLANADPKSATLVQH